MPSIFDWHYNYFIYQTDGAPDGGPSLQLLPRPIRPNVFYDEQVGLLSHGTGYTVVALRDDRSAFFHLSSGPGEFDVYLLHSEDRVWTTKAVTVPPEQQRKSNRAFQHFTHKVITVGGEAGTMAFVDLQHGILLYDVFTGDNLLRYTRVPQQKFLHRVLDDGSTVCDINAATTRDITIVDGWFKFVEVATIMKKASGIHTKYVADWKVTTWCMDAISLQDASWLPGDEVQSAGIGFDYNTLLPNQLPLDEESPLLHLERLVIDHLMHSLNADVVYVMAKIDWQNPDTWVIAVDMSCGQLKGTTKLGAERTRGSRLIYTSGRISQHLFSGNYIYLIYRQHVTCLITYT
jgi:hypothetical protein